MPAPLVAEVRARAGLIRRRLSPRLRPIDELGQGERGIVGAVITFFVDVEDRLAGVSERATDESRAASARGRSSGCRRRRSRTLKQSSRTSHNQERSRRRAGGRAPCARVACERDKWVKTRLNDQAGGRKEVTDQLKGDRRRPARVASCPSRSSLLLLQPFATKPVSQQI